MPIGSGTKPAPKLPPASSGRKEVGAASVAEVLDDLTDRLERGVIYLNEMADQYPNRAERTKGKADGLALVKDWLRSYR